MTCTTSYPASTLTLAEQAKKHALHFTDAPVTRPPEQAEQGASTPSLDRIRTRFLSRLAFLPHLREHRPCG
ncbi:hypothetical protein IVB19_37085 (plasmid) [Bradyrhizobium sp. 187]|nr:hypothetical protein IVB19_37085 [Bradyrhizobium sp. 187]